MKSNEQQKKHVLILGGGFAGLYAALHLEKTLARDPGVEITLVNRENFFLFTPMLHEVAASDLDITHIVNPVRKLLKRVKFFDGEATKIDLNSRTVTVTHGLKEPHPHELKYDHLVLSLGSITNFFNTPGLQRHAVTMKSLGDAIELRNRMIQHLEEADFECCLAVRGPLLTFVIAGGGFAGVETAASMNDFLREAVKFYPHLKEDMLRLVLVQSGPFLLPELGEKLGSFAAKKLAARRVEIRCNTRVTAVTDAGVELSDGSKINAGTLVWTAGTAPNPILETLDCRKERGKLIVDEYMELEGWPGVWALGDCGLVPDKSTGGFCPPTAQHALRQGRVLAKNITAAIRGGRKTPFKFSTIGQLASIGRRTGVARIFGVNFSGFVAWWMWRTIYLSKLPRLEKKIRVALDWTLDLFFSKDLVKFGIRMKQTVAEMEGKGELSAFVAGD
jgi:NADH:quinone reductase (non-electrogenic)